MSEQTEIRIRPNSAWLFLDWRGLCEYRDLLWLLVRRDFVAKYKQTILGPAWAVIQPLLMSVVFTVVFNKVAKIPTGGAPGFLFYLCGLLLWQLFAGTVQSAGNSLAGNLNVFGKVYFPRIIPPLSLTISQLIPFAIQAVIFTGFYIYFYFTAASPTFGIDFKLLPLLPLLVLQTCAVALGVSLCCSALTAKYRDLQHALGFIIQLGLYASPVIIPASLFGKYAWLFLLNPMAAPIEGIKAIFLGGGIFSLTAWGFSVALTVVILTVGLLWYQRTARTFVDTA